MKIALLTVGTVFMLGCFLSSPALVASSCIGGCFVGAAHERLFNIKKQKRQ